MPALELCVDSIASAVAAEAGGADRVELCCALAEGGLTPSLGLLRAVRSRLTIGVHVMIRPRSGDFVYSREDFSIMQDDIALAAAAGANGVVFGILTPGGEVDLERTRQLVQLARPMGVTFHRAIDIAADPMAALHAIIESGADRVLTSGGQPTAVEGRANIRQLVRAAGQRICIMAGGGIRANNLAELLMETGATDWHTAARRSVSNPAGPAHEDNKLAEQLGNPQFGQPILESDVRRLREILDAHADVEAP